MRRHRFAAVSVVSAMLAAALLAGCENEITSGGASAASSKASAVASEAAEKLPTSVPTSMELPAIVIEKVREFLPGNLSNDDVRKALLNGILVSTETGAPCQSKPKTPADEFIHVAAIKLKPGTTYSVTTKPAVGKFDMTMKSGDPLVASMADEFGAFGVMSFSCEGWKAGKYFVVVATEDGTPVYEASFVVE